MHLGVEKCKRLQKIDTGLTAGMELLQGDQMPNNGVLGQLQLKLNSSHEEGQ